MLRARELYCRRGGRKIFKDLSFELNPGDALSVIGPNGSGKSSLLRVLAGLLEASSGVLEWMQKDIHENHLRYCSEINYVSHLDAAKSELTVHEQLDYWRALRSVGPQGEMSDPFNILQVADRAIRLLSAGQRRKLALMRLTLYPSKLWLLDEPMTALDVEGQKVLLGMIASHRDNGGMAVVATHHNLEPMASRQLVLGAAG